MRAPIRVKSSRVSGTPTASAMARRWSTALVDPPSTMLTVMAFSKASLVMIRRGVRPSSSRWSTASPARRQSSRLSDEIASWAELPGRLMPSASMADAIVLAVYMPPHEPGPGMALRSTSSSSSSLTAPRVWAPTASNTEMMSVRSGPGRMVPP